MLGLPWHDKEADERAAEQETVSRSAALLVLKCTRQLAGVIGTISSHRAGGLPLFPHPLQRTVAGIAIPFVVGFFFFFFPLILPLLLSSEVPGGFLSFLRLHNICFFRTTLLLYHIPLYLLEPLNCNLTRFSPAPEER